MTLADVPDGNIVGSNYPCIALATRTTPTYLRLHLDAHQGDFDFNWVGMITDSGVLFAFVNIPLVKSAKALVRLLTQFAIELQRSTGIKPAAIPAETWQFDYTDIWVRWSYHWTGEDWIHLGESKQYTINDLTIWVPIPLVLIPAPPREWPRDYAGYARQ